MAKKSAPANETPEQRFVRLANGRCGAAMVAIDNLGKLVGSQYKSTPAQHGKLFGTLRARLDAAEKALAENKAAVRRREEVL